MAGYFGENLKRLKERLIKVMSFKLILRKKIREL
jgi:hypothetical protein